MNFDDYSKLDRMNASTLVQGFKSMRSLRRAIEGKKPEETAAMKFGQDYHRLILEPDEYRRLCVVEPDFAKDPNNVSGKGKNQTRSFSSATTWAKEARAKFAKENASKIIVKQSESDRMMAMLESLSNHPEITRLLKLGKREQTFQGVISQTECKGRIDLIVTDECIVDLKGTNDVRPHIFAKTACQFHYPEKMGFYQELVRQETGKQLPVKLIVVETSGDFDRCLYTMDQETLDHGLGRMTRKILEYEDAKRTGLWHGVDEGKESLPFRTPNWWMPPDGEDEMLDWKDIETDDDPETMDSGEYETEVYF